MGAVNLIPRAVRSFRNHNISLSVNVIARYSDPAEDKETVGCFFVFQERGEPPS